MNDASFSCFCAHCCCGPCTYDNIVPRHFKGEPIGACLILSCVFGECGWPCKLTSVYCGHNQRQKFNTRNAEGNSVDIARHPCSVCSGENFLFRLCCEGCVLCEEIDLAFQMAQIRNPEARIGYGNVNFSGDCCYLVDKTNNKRIAKPDWLKLEYMASASVSGAAPAVMLRR